MGTKVLWSASNNIFLYESDICSYEKAGWDLSDAINVSHDVFLEYSSQMNPEIKRGVDSNGMPCWIDTPPPSLEQMVANAEAQRKVLIDNAKTHISLWQTQIQLGMISDADKAKLIEWMHYITALQAVDTSTAPDINWPQQPAE